jgi:polysaccharide biosynthesis protein PslG
MTAAEPTVASAATTAKLKPAKAAKQGRQVVFRARRIDAQRLGQTKLRYRGRQKRLRLKRVRRALESRGRYRAKLPRRWLSKARRSHRVVRKRKRIARKSRLVVSLKDVGVKPIDPEELRVGMITNAQGWGMNSEDLIERTAPTGVRWMREEFQWEKIEPQNDQWNWERYDHLLLEAATRGIRILPLLIETPSWAGAEWNTIPADPAEFAEYTAKVVARYGPGGTFWQSHPEIASFAPEHFEIWNEPYLSAFSAGGVKPGRYARLVKAAVSAGRAANPQAKYLLQVEKTPAGDARHTFVDDMYEAVPDLNDYFDAAAAHPYAGNSAPDDPRGGWGFPRLGDVHQELVSHGAGDKPIWITEVGWSTCPNNSEDCVSDGKQASYTAQMFDLLRTKYSSYVEAVFLYRLEDLNSNASDKEGWFGMRRLDGSWKPVYDVLRSATGEA